MNILILLFNTKLYSAIGVRTGHITKFMNNFRMLRLLCTAVLCVAES